MSVSRETPPAPPAPPEARGVFGSALPAATAYVELLASAGVERGLIGPRETPRLWGRHVLNCAVLGEVVPTSVDVCDVGSGAGLPGIPLALARPDLSVTLVEPQQRRSDFLAEAVGRLGLSGVQVVRARAEELHGAQTYAVVTSRAVAPLGRLLDWSMPLVRQGGFLAALKGASAGDEVTAARKQLRRHRVGEVAVLRVGAEVVDPPATVVRVARP